MQGHVPHHGVPYMCNHLENPQAVIVGSLDLDVDVGEPKNVSRTREGITYLGKSNAMRFTKSLRVRTCCRIQEAGGDDNAALKSVKKVLRCFATTYQIRQRRGGPSPPPTLTVLPAQPMPPITTRTPPPPTLTIPSIPTSLSTITTTTFLHERRPSLVFQRLRADPAAKRIRPPRCWHNAWPDIRLSPVKGL